MVMATLRTLALSLLIAGFAGGAGALAQAPAAPSPAAAPAVVDAVKVEWLKSHVVGAGPVNGDFRLTPPPGLLKAKLILLGEAHGSAAPQRIDLAFLTELNRRIGLRDYVAEVDPVQAETLNRHLATGDEEALARVLSRWKGREQWGNSAFMDKVRGIRALNLTLPASRRVRFIGLDAVQDWPLLLDWLEANGAVIDRVAFEALPDSERKRAELARPWAEQAIKADPLLRRRLASLLEARSAGAGREQSIFDNYAYAVRSGELGDRPAYGLWGLFHVMQAGLNKQQPFAMRVKQSDLPAAKALISIPFMALDSAVLIPGGAGMRLTNLNIDGPVVHAPGAANLKAASMMGYSTLWRLDEPGSPYRTSPDLIAVKTSMGQNFIPDDPSLPATAYAQYAGVYRGSDWAPPLK